MTYKSTQSKFGFTAIILHWVSAILIFLMFTLGFAATNLDNQDIVPSLLQGHIALGIIALALTIFRIIWWTFFDQKPDSLPNITNWQNKLSHIVHRLFYAFIIIMCISGIGMMILSGAGEILFGSSPASLPDFEQYPPRQLHSIIAKLFIALIVMHVGAALYHQFALRDGLLKRMNFK